jgi:chitinase
MALPTINVNDVVVSEADGYVEFVVSLSAPGTNAVTVNYSTLSGSASSAGDYTSGSGTLTFAPGETVTTVRIGLTDDTTAEPTGWRRSWMTSWPIPTSILISSTPDLRIR